MTTPVTIAGLTPCLGFAGTHPELLLGLLLLLLLGALLFMLYKFYLHCFRAFGGGNGSAHQAAG